MNGEAGDETVEMLRSPAHREQLDTLVRRGDSIKSQDARTFRDCEKTNDSHGTLVGPSKMILGVSKRCIYWVVFVLACSH